MIGSQDLMVGLVIVLVLFGAKKLPELAGSIGKSMKEFKKGVSEATTEEEPAKVIGSWIVTATVPRKGASCEATLDPAWQHCPPDGPVTPINSTVLSPYLPS